MAPTGPEVLHVGDVAEVEGHGERKVTRIDLCLTPTTDPAGETDFVNVTHVELGEHGPPFALTMEGGGWAYGIAVKRVVVEGPRDG